MKKQIILTGDRPTGPLHVGHFIGSLKNRIVLQDTCQQFVMIADLQALTDYYETPDKVHDNVMQVMYDYLSVGLDPEKTTFLLQSQLPALAELTMYYMNLVTVARLERNPTVKTEIKQKGMEKSLPAGFLCYPISQAADITAFKATLVPVGEDQLPMIEQTNEIVRAFNRLYKKDVLVEAQALIPKCARLSGLDGQAKMGKSLGNALYLSDSADVVVKKIKGMYTDPTHIKIEDPGKIEGNTVFEYLDAFGSDQNFIEELKVHYQRGGLGDMKVKNYLLEVMQEFLEPIRKKRILFEQNSDEVKKILMKGTQKANEITQKTLIEVKEVMHLLWE